MPKVEMRQTIGWRETPIGDISGKPRALIAKQNLADDRVNSICTDNDVAVDGGSVLEDCPRAIVGLNHVDAAATGVNPIHRQRITQGRQQVRAVEMVIWRAEYFFGYVPQLLARQDSTVI